MNRKAKKSVLKNSVMAYYKHHKHKKSIEYIAGAVAGEHHKGLVYNRHKRKLVHFRTTHRHRFFR